MFCFFHRGLPSAVTCQGDSAVVWSLYSTFFAVFWVETQLPGLVLRHEQKVCHALLILDLAALLQQTQDWLMTGVAIRRFTKLWEDVVEEEPSQAPTTSCKLVSIVCPFLLSKSFNRVIAHILSQHPKFHFTVCFQSPPSQSSPSASSWADLGPGTGWAMLAMLLPMAEVGGEERLRSLLLKFLYSLTPG